MYSRCFLLIFLCTLCACQTAKLEWEAVEAAFDHYQPPYLFPDSIAVITQGDRPGLAANFYSYLSREKEAMAAFGEQGHSRVPDTASLVSARQAVLDGAAGTRVLIINEAHHDPSHRAFTRSLLEELYGLGYRHFGLEALTNHPQFKRPIDTLDAPIFIDGYYVREPEMADLIRTAKAIGFQIFGYEHTNQGQQPVREIGQARHIAERMARFPDDKFLIHGGYDHVREGRMPNAWEFAMAQRLKDTTRVNPFTVNQTELERTEDISEVMAVRLPRGTFRPERDSLNYMDLYVTHPVYTDTLGRPAWKTAPDREAVAIDLSTAPASPPYLLAAYREGDDLQRTVPADIVAVDKPTEKVWLFLPADATQLVLRSKDGQAWKASRRDIR